MKYTEKEKLAFEAKAFMEGQKSEYDKPHSQPAKETLELIKELKGEVRNNRKDHDNHVEIYRANGKALAGLIVEIKNMREDVKDLKDNYVPRSEFKPVKIFVFSLIGIIVSSVMYVWMDTLLEKSSSDKETVQEIVRILEANKLTND